MSKKSSQEELPRCLKFLANSSKNTKLAYFQSIRKYEKFHGITIQEAINEALDEQTNQVPSHLLKVIDRLEDFQESLIEEDLVIGSIKTYMTKIKSIYHKNRIDIPYIEPINEKRTRRREYIEYKDVLTKDELRCALKHMRPSAQARAMVMIQGGLSNKECEQLKTRTFLDETYKYHQCDDDIDALRWLSRNPIIWVTKLIRVKTAKPYYAVIGAEAVNKIADAKLYEMELPKNKGQIPEKLLDTAIRGFGETCRKVNRKCGFGLVAEESKLRPHNLRRFHATYIRGVALSYEEKSKISLAEIDEMQGRGKTTVQDTYIKSNPLEQKLIYAKVMNNLSLYNEYEYEITDNDVIIRVKDQQLENKKLRKEVDDLTKKLENKKKASKKVQELRESLGDDVFKEMIGEILNGS